MFHTNSDSSDNDIEFVSCQSGVVGVENKDSNCSHQREKLTREETFQSPLSTTNQYEYQYRPILLMLIGIPGSGKTTFAKKLEEKGWCRVCQDELFTRQQCENYTITHLLQGKSIVIDRCNVTKEQRAIWINLAKNANAVSSSKK
ncbi:Transcription factor bHLH140 [Galdieria sulphuraria]|nr:Transcription factor bHLH140 [Galdieria sulphuraria]